MAAGPWTIEEAREACRKASAAQAAVEDALRETTRDFAEAEGKYRKALAIEIVRQRVEDDVAWTTAPDLARGAAHVAQLRQDRDVAKGVMDAMTHAAWRRNADRKDVQRFADWSQRREFAENYRDADPAVWGGGSAVADADGDD